MRYLVDPRLSRAGVRHSSHIPFAAHRRDASLRQERRIGKPTVCHPPTQSVPQDRLLPAAHADQGVSCENCHAPAENWLRSHTRHDYTYFQRVASGMNDLRNLYQRANTCVACHENLPSDMASAGHPELIFELDSQLVSEPPHWHESDPWAGLHSWLTGQAVAFREETWRMIKEPGESARWESLGWLLQEVTAQLKTLPDLEMPKPPATPQQLGRLQAQSNRLARAAPGFTWTPGISQQLFRQLTKTGDQLRRVNGGDQQVHRAEVITQSLDRLLAELAAHQVAPPGADKGVDNLFADLRQPLYFNRDKFCADLDALAGMAAK